MGNDQSRPNEDDRRNRHNSGPTLVDAFAAAATVAVIGAGVYALSSRSNSQPNPRSDPHTNTNSQYINRSEVLVMYTDASCDAPTVDGRIAAIAGYVRENHPLNFAEILRDYRHNAAAETIAVRFAIFKIRNSSFINNITTLHIKTDFEQLANAMNNGFNLCDNEGEYQLLREKIDELESIFQVTVVIEYIRRGSEEGNRIVIYFFT